MALDNCSGEVLIYELLDFAAVHQLDCYRGLDALLACGKPWEASALSGALGSLSWHVERPRDD